VNDEEREPPRFQDTTERAALPLPLPGNPDGSEEAGRDDQPPLDPLFAPPAAEAFGADAEAAPADPRPEILLGAAFLGGVALALVIKRLGS
jgi:hypothetical protein